MTVKSFKGIIADEGIEQIHLTGGDSDIGYRIVKFQIMAEKPSQQDQESIIKIYLTRQTTATSEVDFSDSSLLGVGLWSANTAMSDNPVEQYIIFDNTVFNQDIYLTHEERRDVGKCNYYVELEEVKMTGPEAANVNFNAAILNTS